MKLFLVQHGEAFSKDIDPERGLSDKGQACAAKVAHFLKGAGVSVDEIWHSDKKRAIETAAIFSKELSPAGGAEKKKGLAPNDPVSEIYNVLHDLDKDIMIVGHLPFLSKLASFAILKTEEPAVVRLTMGGVVVLEREEENDWQVLYGIIPELISV